MGDNPLSPTYCREAVHGGQPTIAYLLQRGSTWGTTHCHPRTASHQFMGDNLPWSPLTTHDRRLDYSQPDPA
ncbi:hypothetical protein PoB_001781700 [Plakobranchus ocellatus]|uniref:Uncharacterized protein n=1 Tax=Plakobranchus ocellatus TaxID=259542 RepID=A0AAV3Z9V3_9GAST|nr:hypothetical protein PoB_001781700 [Plakobranchus ocellatus]